MSDQGKIAEGGQIAEQTAPGVSETSSAAIKSNVFSAIDGKPIRFTDKLGLVHICEGADVHRGVRLIWTLCERDVPAGKAWKLDKPSMHEVCLICLKRSNERAALASAREVQP